ncbi:MAG: histidine--tRNA ligase [Acidobacteria bacterium RIFCSPLOWO2_12_FULL_60_22]|nr:MAG: histidine--tRNA ligase [Acidobacteria bacterium RIFCSPLOWO2_12_FULL_60_22]
MSRIEPLRTIKGMRDILPPESALWGHIEQVAREVFQAYAYQEIRTPIVEVTELFARGVGQDTDIVTKEMYSFEDRDDKSLTLRPEATASVVRAYIEHKMYEQPGLKKLYYMGPMFRRERPQKGRYRQFYQIGAEAIGSDSPAVDAEVIEMLIVLLDRLRLTGFTLWLSSVGCSKCRPGYLATLRSQLTPVREKLCADCQRRSETNPLRVLDCKVPEDQPIIDTLPTLLDLLCSDCRQHFEQLQGYLRDRQIPFTLQPRLVRGLDYYTRTTFEIVHGSLGAQNSLLGGGRYDGLSEELGGPPAPGIGFSIGEDRFALTLAQSESAQQAAGLPLYIVWLGESAFRHAAELARELRARNVAVEVASDPLKLKKALELASRLGARHVLIVGDQELAEGKYPLKDMSAGTQRTVTKEELFEQFVRRENLIEDHIR